MTAASETSDSPLLSGAALVEGVLVGLLDIPAVTPDAVIDPTGCGDAYRAGLLYGLAQRWEWERSGRLASLLGALKIASRGAQNHLVDRDRVGALYYERFGQPLW